MEIKTLKRSHIGRNIIIAVVVIAIISAVVLNFTRAKYRVTDSIEIVNGTVNYTPYDFKMIAMYQEQDGEYVEIESMPSSGYTINEEMSYCTLDNVNHDNEAILYTNANGEHVISGLKKGSKCYLYFDEYVEPLPIIDVIEEAYNNNPTMLAYDNTVDNNLRYIGKNPNNYVYFNCDDYQNPSSNTCELWRIIGVMNNMETTSGTTESLVKLIRNDGIGSYSWDNKPSGTGSSISSEGSNDWSDSTLQIVLNSGAYWNRTSGTCPIGKNGAITNCDFSTTGLKERTKELVEEVIWKLGGTASYQSSSNGLASHWYEYERGTTVYENRATEWSGKVGLMYPSDFGYATSGGSTTSREVCLKAELSHSGWVILNDCYNNDWLFDSNSWQWTLTPSTSDSYYVFRLHNDGSLNLYNASYSYVVRPSVYLISNITISSGDGTSSNPYVLS